METALRARLLADAGVLALAATRVDWGVRPQGTTAPCIVMTVVSDSRSQHMAGFDGFRATRVQIDCYALKKADAVALREAVITALVGEALQSGVSFLRAFINSVLDRGEQTETGFIHREMIDLQLWHNG
jgi:hypothetical protein